MRSIAARAWRVITGFRGAAKLGFTHAIQVDADGQHTLSDARRFVEAAREAPDAVICGRPVFDASIPKARYYGRYLTHGMVWLQTLSFDIIDSMCGFRLYPLETTLALADSAAHRPAHGLRFGNHRAAALAPGADALGWIRACPIPSTACPISGCSWTTCA